jgi:ethanolamine utilization protein EutN
MFVARIDGAIVAVAKHETMQSCRLLVAQRLEADGQCTGEPLVVADWLGAGLGSKVLVSTDGDIARAKLGNTTPVRMVVAGIIDQLYVPSAKARSSECD